MTQTFEHSQIDFELLSLIAGLMIPASEAHGVPAANDPAIMADIQASAQNSMSGVVDALQAFAAIGMTDEARRVDSFRRDHAVHARLLETLIVRCYYRDDRVMKSLGMEPRPPFPRGFEVEQGDWSLLDPVRQMVPIYRPVR